MPDIFRLGRIIAVAPAELGRAFEAHCTVTVMVSEDPSSENGWRRTRVPKQHQLFWYTEDPITKQQIFCTYAGYYDHIHRELSKLPLPLNVSVRLSHKLPEPEIAKLEGVQWRPRQIDVFSRMMAHEGGVIVCPTAFGKSFLIRQLSRVYPTAKIVVTVTSLDVARTLYEELKTTISDLGFCGTGMQRPQRVTVAVTNSLDNCDPEAQLVLVDEAHCALAPSVIKKLNRFRRAKLFGFTASPTGRSDGGDGFMEALFGSTLIDVSYQEGVKHGNIVQLKVRVYKCTSGPKLDGIDDKNYVDQQGIIRNKVRNELVVRATRELETSLGPDAQILVMVDKIEHAYMLYQLLPEYTVVTGVLPMDRRDELTRLGILSAGQKLCTAKDRDTHRKAFERNELKRVIATRVWEKGVDFRDLQGLVRADGLASTIAACQIPGRLSRLGKTVDKEQGILVDINDTFSNNLKGRSRRRLKYYTGNGWTIEHHD